MLIIAFRAGLSEPVSASRRRADCEQRCVKGLEEVLGPSAAIVRTQLVIPPYRDIGRSPKVIHILAHREKTEPEVTFVGSLSRKEYARLSREAVAAWKKRQAEIHRQVESMKPLAAKIVYWKDLTPRQKARLSGADLPVDECWIWRPLAHRKRAGGGLRAKAAPYRDFYIGIKGPIPKSVLLRHKCDNRFCMNPNHLEPGTAHENVRDMMERGRHYDQVLKREGIKPGIVTIPCEACSNPIVVSMKPLKSRKQLGIVYACSACDGGGRMELPPGSMKATIIDGAKPLHSAEITSPRWAAWKNNPMSVRVLSSASASVDKT